NGFRGEMDTAGGMARGNMEHLWMGRRKRIPRHGQIPARTLPRVGPDHGDQHFPMNDAEPLMLPLMSHPAARNIRLTGLDPIEPVHALKIEVIDKGYTATRIHLAATLNQVRVHGGRRLDMGDGRQRPTAATPCRNTGASACSRLTMFF